MLQQKLLLALNVVAVITSSGIKLAAVVTSSGNKCGSNRYFWY